MRSCDVNAWLPLKFPSTSGDFVTDFSSDSDVDLFVDHFDNKDPSYELPKKTSSNRKRKLITSRPSLETSDVVNKQKM
jgi:hypothetical protein